jgi:uncharacterized protein (DUF885 family)
MVVLVTGERWGVYIFYTPYFVLPGQATAYKVGMVKIMELRELAKAELGGQFDIRKFHDVVQTNGSMPLDILEEMVLQYIEEHRN